MFAQSNATVRRARTAGRLIRTPSQPNKIVCWTKGFIAAEDGRKPFSIIYARLVAWSDGSGRLCLNLHFPSALPQLTFNHSVLLSSLRSGVSNVSL